MAKQLRKADIEDDPGWLSIMPDGRVFRDVRVLVTEDQYRQMYQGYMCANCYEPFDSPFPEECSMPGCNFRPKENQRRVLDERFGGVEWLGPSKATLNRLENDYDRLKGA